MDDPAPVDGADPVDANPARLHTASAPLNRRAILWNTAHVASATYVSRAFGALRSIINARCLGPELYGFWGWLSLVLSFGFHLHGGIQDILAREIPAARSHGRTDAAQHGAQLGFTWFASVLAIASTVLLIIAATRPHGTPSMFRIGWAVAALVLPLEVLMGYERIVAKAEERFHDLSRSLLAATTAGLMLTLVLVTRFRMAGLFVAAVITPAIGLLWLRRGAGYGWRLVWEWPQFRRMMRVGWPILLMTIVYEAMGWIDRALVWTFVGMAGFGFYSLGVLLAQCCYVVPEVMASVVEPRLYSHFARQRLAPDVRDHVWFPLRTLALVMPLGLALADLIVPPLLMKLLPAYAPGLPAVRVLLWATTFTGLAVCTRSLVIALDASRQVLRFYAVAIAVDLALGITAGARGGGLVGIATSTLLAALVCCTQLLLFAFHRLGWSWTLTLGRVAKLYAAIAAIWAATVGVPIWLARIDRLSPAWTLAVRASAWLFVAAGVLWMLRRQAQRDAAREGRRPSLAVGSVELAS